jgi:hypothetical protein
MGGLEIWEAFRLVVNPGLPMKRFQKCLRCRSFVPFWSLKLNEKIEMPMQEIEPGLDDQMRLDAVVLAVIQCKDQFNSHDVRSLKLTSKQLKRVADDLFLRSLDLSQCYGDVDILPLDFEILTPALLKNVQKVSIDPNWEDENADIQKYACEIKRILSITSHNLRELSINRVPAPVPLAALIKDNLTWPNLQKLSLRKGNIAGAKQELYSMRQLRSLSFNCKDSNRNDRKTLLSAPFLTNLTELQLFMTRQTLTPLYMSKLFTRARYLETLDLFGNLDFDYFGGVNLANLKNLRLHNFVCGNTHFGPLLAHTWKNLQTLGISYNFLLNTDLVFLIDSAKAAFPSLTCFVLGHVGGEDEFQDWSCLSRIDLPNLEHLHLGVGIRGLVSLVEPTVKLPKLRKLTIATCATIGHPRWWEENAEKIFSSKLLQQLQQLSINSIYFRIESLAILCKHAKQFKNLQKLEVHCYDMDGVMLIARCGKTGGFLNLRDITLHDMDPNYYRYIEWINGKQYMYGLEVSIKHVWPHIEYKCYTGSRDEMGMYGHPDEFVEEEDQIIDLQALHFNEMGDDDD